MYVKRTLVGQPINFGDRRTHGRRIYRSASTYIAITRGHKMNLIKNRVRTLFTSFEIGVDLRATRETYLKLPEIQ